MDTTGHRARRDVRRRPRPRWPARGALLAGAGTFLAGFGVLGTWWAAGDWNGDVPGWTAYRAAVIGDGVCLPVLVAALTHAATTLPPARRDRRAAGWAAAGGAAVGIALQASWLISADTAPNWTIPGPHRFNAPGWYHAAFFVAVTTTLAALAALASRRGWATAREWPALPLIAASASTFAVLQTLDTSDGPVGPGSLAGALGPAAAVLLALALVQAPALRHRPAAIVGRLAAGALSAAAVGASTLWWPRHWGWNLLLAAALVGATAGVPGDRRR